MCDPISASVASAALTVAGSAMAGMQQKNAVDAQNRLQQAAEERSRRMRMEELQRQDQMRNENAASLEKTIQNYDPQNQMDELQKTQNERVDESQKFADEVSAMSPDAVAIPTSNQGNAVVSDDLSKRLALAAAKSREKIAAFAKLGGYDENFGNNARRDEAVNRDINLVNNIRQGSLAASQAGVSLVNSHIGKTTPPDGTIPAIASGLGNVLSSGVKGGVFG